MMRSPTRAWNLIALLCLGLALLSSTGCTMRAARVYEREHLMDRIVSFDAQVKEEARRMRALEAREGSTGGGGGAGGGCACK